MFLYASVKNFLPESYCHELLRFSLENLKLSQAEIGNKEKNLEVRDSQISFYIYDNEFPELRKKISETASGLINLKGFNILFREDLQFTEYKTGQFYNWHKDNNRYDKRHCSIVIQLNNQYTGGELEIIDPHKNSIVSLEKGIGNLFVFLSHLEHRVSPVLTGTRYSLVSWLYSEEKTNYKKTLI